jgi:hypothetical protein
MRLFSVFLGRPVDRGGDGLARMIAWDFGCASKEGHGACLLPFEGVASRFAGRMPALQLSLPARRADPPWSAGILPAS